MSAPSTVVDLAKAAVADLFDLLKGEIALGRVELTAEMREMGQRAGRIALFVAPLLLGYSLAMAALIWWLHGYWGLSPALALVAGVNLLFGIGGIRWAISSSERRRLNQVSAQQVDAISSGRAIAAPARS
jgi:hypothetical protein